MLADQLRETALDYLRTTFHLSDAEFESRLFQFLDGEEGMFRGPYVDVRLPFRKAETGYRIPLEIQPPFVPHAHQVRAFDRLFSSRGHQPQHTLVVTGTGSGKTECFLYPILDHCYRHRHEPGVKAILLYPMNALASDQARRIASLLWNDERLKDAVTAGIYVGGKGQRKSADSTHLIDDRSVLRDNPPHILLTNYKMLDFLMLRPDDRRLWLHNGPETLRYLVLDELHTYDGAQGSDVACLIRRLKARLKITPGALCAVGTSATVGGGSGRQSAVKLTEFATQVFGEYFTVDSVVEEDRQELDEVIELDDLLDLLPTQADPQSWQPSAYASPQDYLAAQQQLWLGTSGQDGLELGLALRQHRFTRCLLQALGGRLLTLDQLAVQVSRYHQDFAALPQEHQVGLLRSYLTLICCARRRVEGQEQPFLTCQTQLWVRELRHLTYHLGDREFRWSEGRGPSSEPVFPPLYCRDCGQPYLAAIQREADPHLLNDLGKVGQAFLDRSPRCRVVQLCESPEPGSEGHTPTFLSLSDLRLSQDPAAPEAVPVSIHRDVSEGQKPKFLGRCPQCDNDDALVFLASRAATLTSVLSSNLFGSEHNRDKKLLAFTDSVQDASHLAGFLASRTYRFSLRSALQATVQEQPGLPLSQLPKAMWDYWCERKGLVQALVTLWPPDLKDIPEFVEFQTRPRAQLPAKLEKSFLQRLSWEITAEYGFNAGVGRTLERTGCSTVYPDLTRLHEAQQRLLEDLQQRRPIAPLLEMEGPSLLHFLQGLLHRMRTRGGIQHSFLRSFVQRGASGYFELSKRRQPWMAPMSSARLPRFVLSSANPNFDHFSGPVSRLNWFRDWAHRILGCDRKDDGIYDLYRFAFKRLEESGLVSSLEVSGNQAFGLEAGHLLGNAQLERLECSACGHAVQIPSSACASWEGQGCLLYRCRGHYQPAPASPGYYARIYRSGQAERIYPYEHTGLLERHEREELEDRFKGGTLPGSPNLLVCTPTLEMGVDVGDLSAVMACSVPPATSNYLQRMGRAGRKTGNAMCLTMVQSRPHDLYFFNSPQEMMRGQVLPPGCFLEAPEMLQRQLTAYTMDQWARQESSLHYLQSEIQFYLGSKGRLDFPGRICRYYESNREALLQGFLQAFAHDLSDAVAAQIRQFGLSQEIPRRLDAAVQAVADERERYRKLIDRCKQRLEELENTPEAMLTPEVNQEKQELLDSQRVLRRLILEVVKKYPLNVLTDAGVLPNYAFPEPGVSLRATVLYRDPTGAGQVEPTSHEYMRPASNALRELAPHNHFYAEGRKIRINEVSLGSKHQPLMEEWRVCDNCCTSIRNSTASHLAVCPNCKSSRWSDRGQVLSLVRMQQVSALCDILADRNTDESEDRESESYHTLDLIAVGPENYAGQAYQIPGLPFGAELLRRLTLREVNFGLKGEASHQIQIAGQEVPDRGFTLCFDCGRVQAPKESEIRHAAYCKHRRGKFKPNQGNIFLYREITSEAIRLLLPAAMLEVEQQLASFKAALMLGFRRKFQGNPLHLLIRRQSEPVQGEIRRHFLVVYDAVPGGTGYLAEMATAEGMREILELAREALSGCSCRTEPLRDGCYRCLFAYQNQYELEFVSRRRALDLLGQILELWDTRESCVTLSDVRLDERLESELEALFLSRLQQAVVKDKGSWNEGAHAGAKSYHLKLGERRWLLRPQVALGNCRPDFLLVPEWAPEGERSLAIFCDGLEYHVCPSQATSRLADDLEKRSALLQSGKHWVLNVTWDDVAENSQSVEVLNQLLAWLRGTGSAPGSACWDGQRDAAKAGLKKLFSQSAWRQSSPGSLREAQQQLVYSKAPLAYSLVHEVSAELLGASEQKPFAHLGLWWQPAGQGALNLEKVKGVLRLFDSPSDRNQAGFKESWRWFLRQWNQYQFLPNFQVTSTSLLEQESYLVEVAAEPLVAYIAEPVAAKPQSPLWDSLAEQVMIEALPCLEALREANAPNPEVGYELTDDQGRILGEAELAWPGARVALQLPAQVDDRVDWAGWTLFTPEQVADLVVHLRKAEPKL